MVVLVLTACPAGLRGHLTRWLLEISPGVFVGHVPARIRDALWSRVVEMCRDGRAVLVYSVRGEQRFEFRVHRHDWDVVDFDGLKLVRRPSGSTQSPGLRAGWSSAARRRKASRR
ncbi:type I-E CRISPR-associated endoribonuclease Cas2e [Acidipropionibacterium timonense]|uniref:type I-E CRISPR-associated endoribonuclease Cas2e n=1 Tax=Acidipropionibacterium timonense TaxID=2161818 RepID=UPI001030B6E9|nr:type I-E CRISPR-associated endoribonuclease Cas2e [Acidipropionibacterium timonense]